MTTTLAALLAITSLTFAFAFADSEKEVKKQLNANYKSVSKAFQDKKIAMISDFLTDDYTITQESGATSNKT
ncbi:MAG: hypothetical protein QOJ65_1385 [Fimbriimonadaceae bacterium]|jgi:hypothetical protein|nr:hypothetical protein [Fimbriimonadaceae bacterium]